MSNQFTFRALALAGILATAAVPALAQNLGAGATVATPGASVQTNTKAGMSNKTGSASVGSDATVGTSAKKDSKAPARPQTAQRPDAAVKGDSAVSGAIKQ